MKKAAFVRKSSLFVPIIKGLFYGFVIYAMLAPHATLAENILPVTGVLEKNDRLTKCNIDIEMYGVVKTIKMVVTAYSSTVSQTDDTPFITASGKRVADGIIANNMLPFGTKVRFPELYGDKVFVVEDRMHWRKGKYHADIWFSGYKEAKNFGAKVTVIEVLEG